MQNIVYERKRNGADFILLHSVTTLHFGNRVANVLVTEQPQYSVPFCIFPTWQNTGILLISNDLRFIFTCPLFLAQPITFHVARHTFGTPITLANNVPLQDVSVMLGHASTRMTQHYARVMNASLKKSMIHVKEQLTQ
ncbi:recombinase [Bacteroides caccae]|uniref:Recombinase n=1 Tax=Bacteroides caccae TaxID=47678 RepID=A0A413JC32_9BACE|nr:recombinase [Bacteroides caccae]RGY29280.1 recombinase [Bacteroides caccae]